jgi:hypothetical protein
MRKLINQLIRVLPLFTLLLHLPSAQAQIRYEPLDESGFTLSVLNLKQTTPKTLEFDVYLLNTEAGQPFELASFQFGLLLNSDSYNGGNITVTYNNTGSGLIPEQQLTAKTSVTVKVAGHPGQTLIRQAGKAPPGTRNGTIISHVGPGTLLTHFTITSTVKFKANTTPDLIFNSSSAVIPLYATHIAQYKYQDPKLPGTNVQLAVTPGKNALICCNPVLNPSGK